jgi:hypothetical protein
MARGDHIRVRRFGYWHHGVDCDDGTVIHYSGELLKRSDPAVQRTTLDNFAKDGKIETVNYATCDDPDAVIQRAESRLNESDYNFFSNNCEHFARWCKTGRAESRQVKRALRAAVAVWVGVGTVVAGLVLGRLLTRGRPQGAA